MKEQIAQVILRFGVAFAFLYAAIDAFADPYAWIDYFPSFVQQIAPLTTLLHMFGFLEVLIALWILSGKKIAIPSVAAALMLIAIVVFNMAQFQLLFRDLSIAAAALALAVMNWPHSAEIR